MIRYVDDYGRLVHTEEYGDVFYVFIRDITEIYEERRENIRRAKVIEGLSDNFSAIFLFNLEKDLIKPYRLQNDVPKKMADEFNLNATGFISRKKMFEAFAEKYIFPEDREKFLFETSTDRIVERMKDEYSYRMTCRCFGENQNVFYLEASIVKIKEKHSNYAVLAFRNVTEVVNEVHV